jgi:hypothetical protein
VQDVFQDALDRKKPIGGASVEEVGNYRATKTGIEGVRVVLRRYHPQQCDRDRRST